MPSGVRELLRVARRKVYILCVTQCMMAFFCSGTRQTLCTPCIFWKAYICPYQHTSPTNRGVSLCWPTQTEHGDCKTSLHLQIRSAAKELHVYYHRNESKPKILNPVSKDERIFCLFPDFSRLAPLYDPLGGDDLLSSVDLPDLDNL